jgi:hypothetical protein
MLKLESVFWSTSNITSLTDRLAKLGFNITASTNEPGGKEIYFGPEAIELVASGAPSAVFESTASHNGINAVALESELLATDFERLQKQFGGLDKFKKASDTASGEPLWYGVPLPETITPALRSWLVMHSPSAMERYQLLGNLPLQHPNTCWGIEGIHLISNNPEGSAAKWGSVVDMPVEGLQWNEMGRSQGKRIRPGDKFLDFVQPASGSPFTQITKGQEGVFMLTLKVSDLEAYKATLKNQGITVLPCNTRDGFIVPPAEAGAPALRFVRTAWKKYDPVPVKGRRLDHFRALGGVYVSSLEEGY